jgi:hypothetical protein
MRPGFGGGWQDSKGFFFESGPQSASPAQAGYQKFFVSFFQKRSACFPVSLTPRIAAVGARRKPCKNSMSVTRSFAV